MSNRHLAPAFPAFYVAAIMLRLKNRMMSPVGGFQFIDPAISPTPIQNWNFTSICLEIQSRRRDNPRFNLPTDMPTIEAEVDLQNAQRMFHIRNAQSFIINEGEPEPNFPRPPRDNQSAGPAGVVKQLATGAAILKDWLGAGGVPVPGEQSEKRAHVCARHHPDPDNPGKFLPCPKNEPGDWLSRFTVPAQQYIRRQLEAKSGLNLKTTLDSELRVCSACICPLQLKVQVPIDHVKAHLSEEVKAKLVPDCWILGELT